MTRSGIPTRRPKSGDSPLRSPQPKRKIVSSAKSWHHRPLLNASPAPAPTSRDELAFTLIELMVVIGLMTLLMVLLTPAFTNIRRAADVGTGASTIASVLEQARNHAIANNTYVWVGFYEEDGARDSTNPATSGSGRVVMSTVASIDGTSIYNSSSTLNPDPIDAGRLRQVNRLVKVDNMHLDILPEGSGDGVAFHQRPTPDSDPFNGTAGSKFGNINATPVTDSAPPTNTRFPFQYPVGSSAQPAQYTFRKTIQFNPRGEARINSTYDLRRVAEIGLRPANASRVDTAAANVAAIQFSAIGGNFKIYRP